MCLAQGPQRSDAGEARTRGPSVSSQALYHWATALPPDVADKQQVTELIRAVNYFPGNCGQSLASGRSLATVR